MSGLVHRFQRIQGYERDCGAAVLASLDSVPDSRRGDTPALRAFNTAAHIQAARLFWLARLVASPAPDRLFYDHAELGDVERLTADSNSGWDRYADDLTQAELDRVARYTSMAGSALECPVADILTHVFNHGTYHRGQIAMLVAQAGGEPAVTDFIFYAYREPDTH